MSPTLIWIFRRNGHALIHYLTLRNSEIDSTFLRAAQIRRNPNILSGYSYKLAFANRGFIFRTQPILLPSGHFYWENIIRKIKEFISPALDSNGYLLRDYDHFKQIFQLSGTWWADKDKDTTKTTEPTAQEAADMEFDLQQRERGLRI